MIGLNLIVAAVVGLLEMIVLIEFAYSEEFESSVETKFRIKRNDQPPCSFDNFLPTYCQPGEVCVYEKNDIKGNYNSCKPGKKDVVSGKLYIDAGYMQLCSDIEGYGFRRIDDLEACKAAAKLIGPAGIMYSPVSHSQRIPRGCNLVQSGRMLPAVVFNDIPGTGRREWTTRPICEQ